MGQRQNPVALLPCRSSFVNRASFPLQTVFWKTSAVGQNPNFSRILSHLSLCPTVVLVRQRQALQRRRTGQTRYPGTETPEEAGTRLRVQQTNLSLRSQKAGKLRRRRDRSNTTGPAAPATAARLQPTLTPKVTAHLLQQENRCTTRAPPSRACSPLSSPHPPTPTQTRLWRLPSTASWNVKTGHVTSLSPVIIWCISSQPCVKRGQLIPSLGVYVLCFWRRWTSVIRGT